MRFLKNFDFDDSDFKEFCETIHNIESDYYKDFKNKLENSDLFKKFLREYKEGGDNFLGSNGIYFYSEGYRQISQSKLYTLGRASYGDKEEQSDFSLDYYSNNYSVDIKMQSGIVILIPIESILSDFYELRLVKKIIYERSGFWGKYTEEEIKPVKLSLFTKKKSKYSISISDYNKSLENNEYILNNEEYSFLYDLNKFINDLFNRFIIEKNATKQNLKNSQKSSISEFDKDGNGLLDTIEVEDEFLKLLKKHQPKIIEVDKSYIQKFVKVSDYHKTQRKNLQTIFENITKTENKDELSSVIHLLKEQIHSYESLIFHSFNMLTSLVDDDLITFYQIHTAFDKLDIFNSNHQNQLMRKLSNIEDGLYSLILSIRSMEQNIIYELNHLSYVTESSYEKLSISVNENLKAIGSSINTNNLLTAINTYQNYSTKRRLNS